jgi:asparagine synthase (glutamine-hydrolysing)
VITVPFSRLDDVTTLPVIGRGGVGVAAAWSASGMPDGSIVARMLTASAHRGRVHRIVTTPTGAVGVSGDHGVEGVAQVSGFALGYAGSIDNPEAVGASATARGDELAAAVLDRVREDGLEQVAATLRGFFSLIVIGPDHLAFCRDHLGLSSLFFRTAGDRAWAASEPKQIVAGADIRREPDLSVVEAVFLGTATDRTPSAIVGVDRAPRAEVVYLGPGQPVSRTYWDPAGLLESSTSTNLTEFKERFDLLMGQAVRRTMKGPSAVSLSGGVDSPAVAAYAAPIHLEMHESPLLALSYVYPDHPSVDESSYIELVADRLAMPLHTREPLARPTDGLAEWVRLFDSPFPVVSVAESADFYGWTTSLGRGVLVTGEWAEYVTEMSPHVLAHLLLSGRIRAATAHIQRQRQLGRPIPTIFRRLGRSLLSDSALSNLRRLAGRAPKTNRPPWIVGVPPVAASRVSPRDRWREDQVSFFAGSGVLLDAHNAIAAQSRIDVRRPFADIDLWEAFLGLRAEVKHGDPSRKGLLRDLLRGRVPDEILDRRDKTVFDADLFSKIDYEALERWLIDPKHRVDWIDYDLVGESLARKSLDLREFMWMKDLAAVHAFLEEW